MYTVSSWYSYDFSWIFTNIWAALVFLKNVIVYTAFVIQAAYLQKSITGYKSAKEAHEKMAKR